MSGYNMEKFSVPTLLPGNIRRENLVNEINMMSGRGTLYVQAPAGFGKTMSAAAWINIKKLNAVWISLDPYDNTEAGFLRTLATALETAADEKSRVAISNFINSDKSSLEEFLKLIEKISYKNPLNALLLDNFDLISDKAIYSAYAPVRSRLAANVRVVMLSRSEAPVEFSELIIKGKIQEMSMDILRFKKEEIKDLFAANNLSVSESDVSYIMEMTEGWPIAVSAVINELKEGEGVLINDIGDKKIRDYIEGIIFEKQGIKGETLKEIAAFAICSFITEELCESVTGEKMLWKEIQKWNKNTGVLLKEGEKYRFLKPVKKYLEEIKKNDMDSNSPKFHKELVRAYIEKKYIVEAIDIAGYTKDSEILEKVMRCKIDLDAKEYAKTVINAIENMPVAQNLRIMLEWEFAQLMTNPYHGMKERPSKIERLLKESSSNNTIDLYEGLWVLGLASSENSIDVLKIINRNGEEVLNSTYFLSFNFPYFHRGVRDFVGIPKFLGQETEFIFERIYGEHGKILSLLLEGGIALEKCDFKKAALVSKSLNLPLKNPELKFLSLVFQCEVLRCEYSPELPALRQYVNSFLIDESKTSLKNIFDTYLAVSMLSSGDLSVLPKLLSPLEYDTGRPLTLSESFEYMSAARALIAIGNIQRAIGVLDRLISLFGKFHRVIDKIEASTLKAICFYHLDKQNDSYSAFSEALTEAQKFNLFLPIAKEGSHILPVIQKILNRLKTGHDTDLFDKSFVTSLLIHTKHMTALHGEHILNKENVKLSQRQSEILILLSQGLSYNEMAEKTGTKITTIRDHVTKLYKKLAASDSADALGKARKLGLIE